MALPDVAVGRVRRWVADQNERIDNQIDEMRVEMDVDARSITILECRPPWDDVVDRTWSRQPIARLRYTSSVGSWQLYWSDRNSKFHRYEEVDATPKVDRLLAEIDEDPNCIFWG